MIESVQKQLEHSLNVLAVESSHSWDDIEKQYRQLIQRWHPDRNTDENSDAAQYKFIEINAAYKLVKDYYRKNGAIPRPISTEHTGPLLGTKKLVQTKTPLHKNKLVIGATIGLILVSGFGSILWSLDSRLAENNRDRATVEKTEMQLQTQASSEGQSLAVKPEPIKQSTNEVEQ